MKLWAADMAAISVGSVVGVMRSNGTVTAARVENIDHRSLRVVLDSDGSWKEVTPDMVYSFEGF